MKVLLSPIGSRGDLQPQLVLAEELRRRGHEVTFATCPNFRAVVESEGFPFAAVGGDSYAMIRDNAALAEQNPLSALPRQLELVTRETERQCRDLLNQSLPSFDLIVAAGLSFAARLLAERQGARYSFVCYTLTAVNSSAHPPPALPVFGLPRFMNRALWALMKTIFKRTVGVSLARVRRDFGLESDPDPWHSTHSTHAVLAQDELFGTLPTDARGHEIQVPALTRLAGDAALPPAVEHFLERRGNERLVYVGFGSMPSVQRAEVVSAVTEFCRVKNARALLFSAHHEDAGIVLPESILSVGALDHARLFPRLDLVVHHGGAGTTATALRAGVPQVLVPHIVDQFFHARRIAELGVGPKPLKKRQLRAGLLALSFSEIAAQRERAAELAQELVPTGAPAAADFYEHLVRTPQA